MEPAHDAVVHGADLDGNPRVPLVESGARAGGVEVDDGVQGDALEVLDQAGRVVAERDVDAAVGIR